LFVGVCGAIRAWDAEYNDWYLVTVVCGEDRKRKQLHEWQRTGILGVAGKKQMWEF